MRDYKYLLEFIHKPEWYTSGCSCPVLLITTEFRASNYGEARQIAEFILAKHSRVLGVKIKKWVEEPSWQEIDRRPA